jgi:hypothetical protein
MDVVGEPVLLVRHLKCHLSCTTGERFWLARVNAPIGQLVLLTAANPMEQDLISIES